MPKRKGYLYEQVISRENCIAAEMDMTKHKTKNRRAFRVRNAPEVYGVDLADMLKSGAWKPAPYREKVIIDGRNQKERRIKVPCLRDQAVHHAVMRVTVPYIERRNYFYNCGSVPKAGQTKATKAIKGWMKAKKPPKYGENLDIKKFYDTCPHSAVMAALRRIFKDERFLALHEQILASMSDSGIGLAIGFYPSQWYANLVLQQIDNEVKHKYGKKLKMVRYMDNYGLMSNKKRFLHKARELIQELLQHLSLRLNRTWQVFQIRLCGFPFLSYRFFHGYTILAKGLMYRMARRFKRAKYHLDAHTAAGILSYVGILKHCNSYNFRKNHVYPYISIKKCKEVVSNAAKNRVCSMSPTVYGGKIWAA